MFQKITENWSIVRAVRLFLGIFIIIQSINIQNYWMIIPGVVFGAMALFNAGCCGKNCSV